MLGLYYLISLLSLLSLLPCFAAQDTGTLEVDLVFPRNDIYAPADLMPVVFSIQGSRSAALGMDLYVSWKIFQQTVDNDGRESVHLGLYGYESFNGGYNSNTFFQIDGIFNITNIEATWLFIYSVDVTNCTGVSDYLSNASPSGLLPKAGQVKQLLFTTKNGAAAADLTAATAQSACVSGNQSFILDITGYMNLTKPSQLGGGFTKCAVMTSISPSLTPAPCAVTIDASLASNISATVTQNVCSRYNLGNSTICPQPVKTGEGNRRHYVGATWLAGGLALIMYNIVI